MRRTWLWLSSALLLLALLPLQTQAQTTTPPLITALAAPSANLLFAGTQCGAYEWPGGPSWTKIAGLDQQINELVALRDGTVFASSGGLYRRAPGGSWEQATDPSSGISGALAVNPAGNQLYVGGESVAGARVATVFRSDDAGRTWQQLSSPGGERTQALAVTVDPASGLQVITALIATSGRSGGVVSLTSSIDGGATWIPIPASTPGNIAFSFYKLRANNWDGVFYAAGYTPDNSLTRLFRLPAAGAALEEIALPDEIRREGINDVAGYYGLEVIGSRAGLFYRQNGGGFQRFENGLNGATVNVLQATAGVRGGISVFAGADRGVFTAYPGISESWFDISAGLQACPQAGPSPYERIPAFEDTPTRRYFAETGHSLSYEFKAFWERNGGLPVFGLPLSEEFSERNLDLNAEFTTQYLERERFEFHPENRDPYRVLLGRLGDELLQAQGRDWRNEGGAANPFQTGPCQTFSVGGQPRTVCGPFLNYWRTHGLEFDGRRGVSYNESLALFGLPLTAPKIERNPDGDEVLTQWFERARFEYHPNNPEPYKVLLGRLGSEVLRSRGVQVP